MPVSDALKLRLLLRHTPEKIAAAFTTSSQMRWGYNKKSKGWSEAKCQAEELKFTRQQFMLLMPEHEPKARDIIALLTWPEGMGSTPTFDEVMGICSKCRGTGDEGFTMRIRCSDCNGTGFAG